MTDLHGGVLVVYDYPHAYLMGRSNPFDKSGQYEKKTVKNSILKSLLISSTKKKCSKSTLARMQGTPSDKFYSHSCTSSLETLTPALLLRWTRRGRKVILPSLPPSANQDAGRHGRTRTPENIFPIRLRHSRAHWGSRNLRWALILSGAVACGVRLERD